MIQSKVIPLGPWRPDQPDLDNGISRLVNAIPQKQSYRQVNNLTPISDALPSRVLRAIMAVDSSSVINNFAGVSSALYRLSGATYADVSKVGGYTASSWEMVKFGERIIAASIEDPIQFYDMGASTLFSDLPGTPPQAKHIAVVRDFVVLGNLDDGGTQYPSRVQWSGFNNSDIWGVNAGAQADFQDLFGNGGAIQRIVPGEYGVIFQENSIWRMNYAGPPTIFRFDEVERGRGTPAPNSVTWLGQNIFYWGHDGFYSFNGQQSVAIGAEKVDRYVKDKLDTSRYDQMVAGIDRRNNLVMWAFPCSDGCMELVFYNWAVGEWGHSSIQVEAINEFADSGYTLDDLDTILADIDSASINVDTTEFLGGSVRLGAFGLDHKLASFTGPALTAEIDTGETLMPMGMRFYISSVRPMVEGAGDYSIALGQRNKQSDLAVFGDAKPINDLGESQFHKDVRFPRFRLKLEGGFTHATGIDVLFKKAGRI